MLKSAFECGKIFGSKTVSEPGGTAKDMFLVFHCAWAARAVRRSLVIETIGPAARVKDTVDQLYIALSVRWRGYFNPVFN